MLFSTVTASGFTSPKIGKVLGYLKDPDMYRSGLPLQ